MPESLGAMGLFLLSSVFFLLEERRIGADVNRILTDIIGGDCRGNSKITVSPVSELIVIFRKGREREGEGKGEGGTHSVGHFAQYFLCYS